MTDNIEQVVRNARSRAGFELVGFREVGLPVFRFTCLVALQEISDIGTIEKFLLRVIQAGIRDTSSITNFLGLPRGLIERQIGSLIYEGVLAESVEKSTEISLTKKGIGRLDEGMRTQIVRERVPLYYDGITRMIIPLDGRVLYNARELEQDGLSMIPPTPRRPPNVVDLKIDELNQLFRTFARGPQVHRKAVKVEAIIGFRSLFYRRAIALAYKSDTGRKVEVGFLIDRRIAREHEVAYARSGDPERSSMFSMLFDPQKRRREVQKIRRYVRNELPEINARLVMADQRNEPRESTTLRLPRALLEPEDGISIRTLSVTEYAPLLRQAFVEAQQRLLIISPWIRAGVVNHQFLKSLVECLKRGVCIRIEYGVGKNDRNERPMDETARQALEALSKSTSNFSFVRAADTHAKVLLVDDRYFVITSFNWLSFQGDPNQPLREEWGTYVAGKRLVDDYYGKLARE